MKLTNWIDSSVNFARTMFFSCTRESALKHITKMLLLVTLAACVCALSGANARAQSTSVFATGLRAPTKIILSQDGNLLVAEAGNGPNTGRVSIVDRSGNRRTVLDGLPAGLAAPNLEPSGPEGLAGGGRTLFIAIGIGDVVRVGPRPGSEVPNPNGPSSPILSSVLAAHFDSSVDHLTGGFTLNLADQFTLADGFDVTLENSAGERVRIELVADFRDFVPDPRTIVRPSHPFGIEFNGNELYVVDAAQNTVMEVKIDARRVQTRVRFAPLNNPTPVGPPQIEAVPTSIRQFGDDRNEMLVTLLSGFPFPVGGTQVRKINVATRSNELLISGLSSAIDVVGLRFQGRDQFYVLEFSANQLAQAPGRLLRFDAPNGPPAVVANDLITPTSMAPDFATGAMFVTEIFTGRIIRVGI